jgi:hypothetical protein
VARGISEISFENLRVSLEICGLQGDIEQDLGPFAKWCGFLDLFSNGKSGGRGPQWTKVARTRGRDCALPACGMRALGLAGADQ